MRLAEEKVKDGLEHPDRLARELALEYFAKSYSRDPDVMPRVIRAIDARGHAEAFHNVYQLQHLAQTEASVDWLIRELNRPRATGSRWDDSPHSYDLHLGTALAVADVGLLASRADDIRRAPRLDEDSRREFEERLRLASLDAAACWAELDAMTAAAAAAPKDSGHLPLDWTQARRVVEGLARHPGQADRVLELLTPEPLKVGDDSDGDPAFWREPLLAVLAGELHLEPAVPRILARLKDDCGDIGDDFVNALVRIGSDAAVTAVVEAWPTGDCSFRLYASGVLERIHSDAALRACLALLPGEEDGTIRAALARAAVNHLADESFEPARRMVLARDFDESYANLKEDLVTAATLVGTSFPEYSAWKVEVEKDIARREEQARKARPFLDRLAAAGALGAPAETLPRREDLPQMSYEVERPAPQGRLAPFTRGKEHVGRNDPCPCGSGKKFKKCCMTKQ